MKKLLCWLFPHKVYEVEFNGEKLLSSVCQKCLRKEFKRHLSGLGVKYRESDES